MTLIDSHAHLTDERLRDDVVAVMERARAAGVAEVITIGSDAIDSRRAVELAEEVSGVHASVGIHPHVADEADDAALGTIRDLAAARGVVAIGETGLDYHYDNAPRSAQRDAFERQLALGLELDLPVVVHARSADADVAAMLRDAGARGVLHCFSSGRALLETALDCGWYVSFSGLITFAKYEDAELVRAVPVDRILVETDSPYLAPVPHRGKRNEPAHVALVARRAAELRGEDAEEFVASASRNTRALFRLPG